jgi:transposase
MLEIEEYIMIRELHAQGFSITDISDKTGYDRKTVMCIQISMSRKGNP